MLQFQELLREGVAMIPRLGHLEYMLRGVEMGLILDSG